MISHKGAGGDFPRGMPRQAGVALAIVVWFIAGMSLLVAGIVALARVDTQMAQLHVSRAKAVAAGDGAVQLMLVDVMTAPDAGVDTSAVDHGEYRLGDIDVSVTLVPISGLIDINAAPVEVLLALFVIAGGVDEERARLIAENVIKSRTGGISTAGTTTAKLELDSPEDLLRIDGFSRSLLDNLRDFIVVGISTHSSTDWTLSPDILLDILDRAYPEKAAFFRARRADREGSNSRGGARLNGDYRADAIVRYGDSLWLRRRWITSG